MKIPYLFKRSILSLAIASPMFIGGCGGSNDTTDLAAQSTDITLERGPVLYAHVIDAAGVKGEPVTDASGNPTNQYRFRQAPAYPVTATGGYIDLDASGNVSVGDLEMGSLKLQAWGEKITLASSLAEGVSLEVLQDLGFSYEQLTTQTPSSDLAIAALSDEVFAYMIRNDITDVSDVDLSLLASQIATRVSDYQMATQTALELERRVIAELQTEGWVATVDDATVEDLLEEDAQTITQASFADMPLVAETQELIAFSWDEEKMAKDLYLNLYDTLSAQGVEIKALYNVPTKSESKHQQTMQNLAEKYDLDLITFAGSDGDAVITGYDQAALDAVANAEFILPEVQAMYDGLWDHASNQGAGVNAISALEAACMVEVIDVNDLNESIEQAEALGAQELVVAFESLRSGSYNHYWAFDGALVQQGVADGCGSLGVIDGVDFDQDYPQLPKGR